MCQLYTWYYSCACPAPKLPPQTPHYCPLYLQIQHPHQLTCKPTHITSYLPFACTSSCTRSPDPHLEPESQSFPQTKENSNEEPEDRLTNEHVNDNYLYQGSFEGETSQEDRYFGRSRSPLGQKEVDLKVPRWRDRSPNLGEILRNEGLGLDLGSSGIGWRWEWDPGMGVGIEDVIAAGVGEKVGDELLTPKRDGVKIIQLKQKKR